MMMKHVFSFVLLGLGAAALGGCPIYSDDQRSNRVCVGSDCYSCPDPYLSDSCYGFSCYDRHATARAATPAAPATIAATLTDGVPPSPSGHALHEARRLRERLELRRRQQVPRRRLLELGLPVELRLQARRAACPTCEAVGGDGGTSACKSDSDCRPPAGSKCLSGTCYAPGRPVRRRHAVRGRLAMRAGCMHPVVQRHQALPDRLRLRHRQGRLHRQPGACTDLEPVRRGKACVAAALRRSVRRRARPARRASSASTAVARPISSRSSPAPPTASRTSARRAASASATAATSAATRTPAPTPARAPTSSTCARA